MDCEPRPQFVDRWGRHHAIADCPRNTGDMYRWAPGSLPSPHPLDFADDSYCPSGIDIMAILIHLKGRPNPTIDVGAIDCSVSLTLCDLDRPDMPIIYVSDGFCELTGYSAEEVLGRNPRFMQLPPNGFADGGASVTSDDRAAIGQVSKAMSRWEEIQIPIANYKKNGQRFTNIMSIVPLRMELGDARELHNYAVGLQCEV